MGLLCPRPALPGAPARSRKRFGTRTFGGWQMNQTTMRPFKPNFSHRAIMAMKPRRSLFKLALAGSALCAQFALAAPLDDKIEAFEAQTQPNQKIVLQVLEAGMEENRSA